MNFTSVIIRSTQFALKPNSVLFLTLTLINIFQAAVVYVQFGTFSIIVDEIIEINNGTARTQQLLMPMLGLCASFIAPSLLNSIGTFYRAKFKMQQTDFLDLYRIEKQGSLDIGTLESSSYQNLLRSAHEWGSKSISIMQDFVLNSLASFAGIITSMIILWTLNNWLIVFALLAAAPVYVLYKKYSREIFDIRWSSLGDHRMIVNRTAHFEELHKAVDVVLLGLQSLFRNQLQGCKKKYTGKMLEAEKKKATGYGLLSLWYLLFLFAALILMTTQSAQGGIAIGGLIMAFNTYTRFYQTVNAYIESISIAEEASLYAGRWLELFELKPLVKSKENATPFRNEPPPTIEFRNVSFSYPHDVQNRLVLQNLNFTIKPGERVAIVGINGSGKTTLIKLLCRVYDPTEGAILVNGTDLRDLDLHDWQRTLGVLFQDFPLYNMSIRESIAIGNVEQKIDAEKLREAAAFSGSEEFIAELPKKFDQLIWKGFEDGTDLSKGQQQRLAVARMFYRHAPVTILDEPTASVDAITEERIFTMLEKNMGGSTVVLITHRFSTVKNADRIIMLEHGRIIENGSHEQLMSNPIYASLYSLQAKRFMTTVAEADRFINQ
jgi:ABC-type multidrug transport system fused ATPase/permease subunit